MLQAWPRRLHGAYRRVPSAHFESLSSGEGVDPVAADLSTGQPWA